MSHSISYDEWFNYEVKDPASYVSSEHWGYDHWQTLLYLEHCAVDHNGIIDNRRMRCNLRLHREFAGLRFDRPIDGGNYPTRLAGNKTQERHDDWSCLEDFVAAGLITATWRVKHDDQMFGGSEAKIAFTPKGIKIAHQLRAHKSTGGTYANFQLNTEEG